MVQHPVDENDLARRVLVHCDQLLAGEEDFEAKRLEQVAKTLDYSMWEKIKSPKKMGQTGAEGDTDNAAKGGGW